MDFTQPLNRYVKVNDILLKPGNFYQFNYLNYENDPKPLIYYLNYRDAINIKTKKYHKYIQGINFHYIPMGNRIRFVANWLKFVEMNKSILLSNFLQLWTQLVRRYPFLENAYRRYLLEPKGLMRNMYHIKTDLVVPMVKGSLEKDFTFNDRLIFLKKYREFNKTVNTNNVKVKFLNKRENRGKTNKGKRNT